MSKASGAKISWEKQGTTFEGEFYTFEKVGQEFVGIYVKSEPSPKFPDRMNHTFTDQKDKKIYVLSGSGLDRHFNNGKAILDPFEKDKKKKKESMIETVKPGSLCKIRFAKSVPNKKKGFSPFKSYEVFVAGSPKKAKKQ